MNDRYLWNKAGNDPEIEALENQLAVFRSAVKKAPTMTRTTVNARQPLFAGFQLKMAFAGFASLLVAVGAIWFSLAMFPANDKASITFEDRTMESAPISIPAAPATERRAEKQSPVVERIRQVGKVRVTRAPASTGDSGTPVPDPLLTAALTAEEQHAYNQLMLALSITSSSLKQVQDRIDGEDPVEVPLPVSESLERSN